MILKLKQGTIRSYFLSVVSFAVLNPRGCVLAVIRKRQTPVLIARMNANNVKYFKTKQMKKEFIKETLPDGGVIYLTEADGLFVSGSLSSKEPEAREFFNSYPVTKAKKEVLETVEIYYECRDSSEDE